MKPSERVSALYTEMYSGGIERDWRDAGAADKTDNIIEIWTRAKLPERPHILEIGCGEGAIGAALASRDFFSSYVGYDLSPSGVREAVDRNVVGGRFELVQGDVIPVADDSADLVVLSHVVEHLEHPRVLISEAKRIAKHVIIEVPLELTLRMPRDFVWNDLGHINHYTATSIRQLLQTCGLEVLNQFTTNPPHALFGTPSQRQRLSWKVKDVSLRVAAPAARGLFVYHETLLTRR